MLKPAAADAQLAAVAASIDRSNRPASLMTIPLVLLVAATIFAGISFRSMSSRRAAVAGQAAQLQLVRSLAERLRAEQTAGLDLATLYSDLPFFGSQVGQDSWQTVSFSRPPVVSNVTSASAVANPPIVRYDVTCSVDNEPLDKIFEATEKTLHSEPLVGRAFVSQANLTPTGTGWRATLRFSAYAKK
ncbi:MAG: hypothetical protein SFZ24_05615 [Planctomycetota bacterium]|nr:hypothetical protein [Planctomycetota bacterium]